MEKNTKLISEIKVRHMLAKANVKKKKLEIREIYNVLFFKQSDYDKKK